MRRLAGVWGLGEVQGWLEQSTVLEEEGEVEEMEGDGFAVGEVTEHVEEGGEGSQSLDVLLDCLGEEEGGQEAAGEDTEEQEDMEEWHSVCQYMTQRARSSVIEEEDSGEEEEEGEELEEESDGLEEEADVFTKNLPEAVVHENGFGDDSSDKENMDTNTATLPLLGDDSSDNENMDTNTAALPHRDNSSDNEDIDTKTAALPPSGPSPSCLSPEPSKPPVARAESPDMFDSADEDMEERGDGLEDLVEEGGDLEDLVGEGGVLEDQVEEEKGDGQEDFEEEEEVVKPCQDDLVLVLSEDEDVEDTFRSSQKRQRSCSPELERRKVRLVQGEELPIPRRSFSPPEREHFSYSSPPPVGGAEERYFSYRSPGHFSPTSYSPRKAPSITKTSPPPSPPQDDVVDLTQPSPPVSPPRKVEVEEQEEMDEEGVGLDEDDEESCLVAELSLLTSRLSSPGAAGEELAACLVCLLKLQVLPLEHCNPLRCNALGCYALCCYAFASRYNAIRCNDP